MNGVYLEWGVLSTPEKLKSSIAIKRTNQDYKLRKTHLRKLNSLYCKKKVTHFAVKEIAHKNSIAVNQASHFVERKNTHKNQIVVKETNQASHFIVKEITHLQKGKPCL